MSEHSDAQATGVTPEVSGTADNGPIDSTAENLESLELEVSLFFYLVVCLLHWTIFEVLTRIFLH